MEQSNDDPLAMYLIISEELSMSPGKLCAQCAQCAHASQNLTQLYYLNLVEGLEETADDSLNTDIEWDHILRFRQWLKTGCRKIVLKADSSEWKKLKEEFANYPMTLVVDAGHTQIPAHSETVIGLFPMYKSKAPKIIKRLQALP